MSIGEPIGRDRRPPNKPTEDRKLLLAAPYADTSFLDSDAWRSLRIMGEFVEGFDNLARLGPAVTIFGSARTRPDHPNYKAAEALAAKFADKGITVITGGGPGIMEAANKGASEAGGVSVGLGIELPHEQSINDYCNLALNFRYFFVRKTMFVKYAQGFVIFPGGYGTFDELFESLTLVQTGKIDHFPVILWGKKYWEPMVEWLKDPVAQEGMIARADLNLFRMTDDSDEIVDIIEKSFAAAEAAQEEAEASPRGKEPAEAAQEKRRQRHRCPE
ncbi:MAG: TIGR00730 family Rossman fold protein [Candidatus Limnocylindrales bacterium]